MKSDFTQLLTVVTCLITFVLMYVKAVCPPKPLDKVHDCTANVIPELSQGAQSNGPQSYKDHVLIAQEKCRNFKLRDVAKCIQDILDNCRGTTDDEQTLHRLIDKDKTLKSVEYFCNHITVYERHAECISNHHNDTYNCSRSAHKSFVNKERAGANIDVLIMGSCRFYATALGCITNTTAQFCGAEASNFVYTLMTGTMPPYCEVTYYPAATTSASYTDGAEVTSSFSWAFFLGMIVIAQLCSSIDML